MIRKCKTTSESSKTFLTKSPEVNKYTKDKLILLHQRRPHTHYIQKESNPYIHLSVIFTVYFYHVCYRRTQTPITIYYNSETCQKKVLTQVGPLLHRLPDHRVRVEVSYNQFPDIKVHILIFQKLVSHLFSVSVIVRI